MEVKLIFIFLCSYKIL